MMQQVERRRGRLSQEQLLANQIVLRSTRLIGKTLGFVIVVFVLVILALALTHRTPPFTMALGIGGNGATAKAPPHLTLMTWNLGYAGLGKESDFFMDGGKGVLAKDSATVVEHLRRIKQVLEEEPKNIYLFQGVDFASRRSYYINEVQSITDEARSFYQSFALNYDVLFVPYPFTNPTGRVHSGILSLSKDKPTEATRLQLPGFMFWPVSAFVLDRCMLVWRMEREDGKQWVIVNLHLSSYDPGGKLREQQFIFVKDFAEHEYKKGNYVILGGDWNNILPGIGPDQFVSEDKKPGIDMLLADEFTPRGWHWGVPSDPTNRIDNTPYQPGKNYVTVIDGFLVSPNVHIQSVATVALGFRDSDHNPVVVEVVAP
jgi:endonuclease/exonuclease/phosphatase family metal-dependent hydrolase